MAEQVQAALDRMVPPLKDLMERNIFSSQEVHAIVERRRTMEYLLRRRAARKADFLRYIEAETQLEDLRRLRTEQRKRDHRNTQKKTIKTEDTDEQELKDNANKDQQYIGDVHIVQHIHLLCTRAIRKFRSDLSLHLMHVDFCKRYQAWTKLGQVYAEALQIFGGTQPGLWIEAASIEWFTSPRKSIRNARILLQRGLRRFPTSQELWVESLSLELHYAQTLRGRRQILIQGGGNFTEVHQEDTNEATAVEEYKIAGIILENALQANITDSISFRLRLLDTCRQFPLTESLMDRIHETLLKHFGDQPQAWIARAMYEAEKKKLRGRKQQTGPKTVMDQAAAAASENENENENDTDTKNNIVDNDEDTQEQRPSKKAKKGDPVIAILEEAMEAIPTDQMYLMTLRFALRYMDDLQTQQQEDDDDDDDDDAKNCKGVDRQAFAEAQSLIDSILSLTSKKPIESSELALEKAEYYVAVDDNSKAIEVLKSFCNSSVAAPEPTKMEKTLKSSASNTMAAVWIRWASLASTTQEQTSILKQALGKVALCDSDHLPLLLQYFGSLLQQEQEYKQEKDDSSQRSLLQDTFQKILLLAPTAWDVVVPHVEDYSFGISTIAQAYLQYLQLASERFGLQACRKIYQAILFQSTIPSALEQQGNDNDDVDDETLQRFVDLCIQLEQGNRGPLCRIYDRAIELMKGTPLEHEYRQDKNDKVLFR